MRKPTEPVAHQKGSFRQLLRMRNFRLLWGAGALLALLCLAAVFRREVRGMKMVDAPDPPAGNSPSNGKSRLTAR